MSVGTPHTRLSQIKQQHCQVGRGDAADAACLTRRWRAEPASTSPAPRPASAARRRTRSSPGICRPSNFLNRATSFGLAVDVPAVLGFHESPARPPPASRVPNLQVAACPLAHVGPVHLRAPQPGGERVAVRFGASERTACNSVMPCSLALSTAPRRHHPPTRSVTADAASAGGRRCRAAAAGGTRPGS